MKDEKKVRVGLDIGSTTLKAIAIDGDNHPLFTYYERHRKVLAPSFTPFISPLLPKLFGLAGYDVDILPVSKVNVVNRLLLFVEDLF